MVNPREHYDALLAEHYTWMLGGDVETLAASDKHFLRTLGLSGGCLAVDLGCGPGPQTYALSDLGFTDVVGVDTSRQLLEELAANVGERTGIRTVQGDLVTTLPEVLHGDSADAVVCMRDTLLHLPDRETAATLFAEVRSALSPGGSFVLTYRDMSTPLAGLDRFLPTRSDSDRIMMCVLDYPDDDTAIVNDLIRIWDGSEWVLHKSSYPKLRLSPDWVTSQLRAAGLDVRHHTLGQNGMWATVGTVETGKEHTIS